MKLSTVGCTVLSCFALTTAGKREKKNQEMVNQLGFLFEKGFLVPPKSKHRKSTLRKGSPVERYYVRPLKNNRKKSPKIMIKEKLSGSSSLVEVTRPNSKRWNLNPKFIKKQEPRKGKIDQKKNSAVDEKKAHEEREKNHPRKRTFSSPSLSNSSSSASSSSSSSSSRSSSSSSSSTSGSLSNHSSRNSSSGSSTTLSCSCSNHGSSASSSTSTSIPRPAHRRPVHRRSAHRRPVHRRGK